MVRLREFRPSRIGRTSISLRLKFNLSLLAVMLLGLGVSEFFLHDLLRKNAREEVLHEAGLMTRPSPCSIG